MKRDERRAHFRQQASTLYLPYYDALCAKLGPEWQPYSLRRSFDEQTRIYKTGREIPPIGKAFIISNAQAGESAHNYSAGSDWARFDGEKLLWLKREDPTWAEYVAAVKEVGLKAGADFGDVGHNELLLTCSWKHVKLCFDQGGMTAAQQKIEVALAR